jgi:hypothetical protein
MKGVAGTQKAQPRSTAPARPSTREGTVVGYVFQSKGFSRVDIDANESDLAYSLAGQLTGLPLK